MSGHRAYTDVEQAGAVWLEIPDPGDTGSFGEHGGFINLVTGGTEARTLADPVGVGELLTLNFLTDGGGTLTITATSGVNQAGNTSIALADANDYMSFISIRDGEGTYAWRILINDGASLS